MNAIQSKTCHAMQASGCDAPGYALAESRHSKRISRVVEWGILVFVILGTLMGNLVTHSYLMRDMLIA